MIVFSELCEIASFYMSHEVREIRREAVILLGSLITIEIGR